MLRNTPWAVLALALALLVGGARAGGDKDKGKPGTKVVTLTDGGLDSVKTKLAKGDTLVLKLKATPSTGFTWVIGKGDDARLKPLGKPEFEKPAKPRPGAGGVQVFRFEAVAAGSGRLEMWYKRPFEKDKAPAKKFTVSVEIE